MLRPHDPGLRAARAGRPRGDGLAARRSWPVALAAWPRSSTMARPAFSSPPAIAPRCTTALGAAAGRPALARRMGGSARAQVLERFTWAQSRRALPGRVRRPHSPATPRSASCALSQSRADQRVTRLQEQLVARRRVRWRACPAPRPSPAPCLRRRAARSAARCRPRRPPRRPSPTRSARPALRRDHRPLLGDQVHAVLQRVDQQHVARAASPPAPARDRWCRRRDRRPAARHRRSAR